MDALKAKKSSTAKSEGVVADTSSTKLRRGQKLGSCRIAGDPPGIREFSSCTLESRYGDLARFQTEIWLDPMPTSPTRRFYNEVGWNCKHWPTPKEHQLFSEGMI